MLAEQPRILLKVSENWFSDRCSVSSAGARERLATGPVLPRIPPDQADDSYGTPAADFNPVLPHGRPGSSSPRARSIHLSSKDRPEYREADETGFPAHNMASSLRRLVLVLVLGIIHAACVLAQDTPSNKPSYPACAVSLHFACFS